MNPTPANRNQRVELLVNEHYQQLTAKMDRLFIILFVVQFLAAVAAAFWISPHTWIGTTSYVHVHVIAAIFLGAAIASMPIFLAITRPAQPVTRHTIAVAQMLFSALLIHVTGGRIETHFHVFGSLAILMLYRDWRVVVSATVVVAADHFLRGVYWPESVFGVAAASHWRWLEHAGWVVFEDIFLISACVAGMREMYAFATRQVELAEANDALRRAEAVERDRAEAERVAAGERVELSRQAGMAEVATGVLHNVGNVLNSVNIAAANVAEKVRANKAPALAKAAAMIRDHAADLPSFLADDPRGKQLPAYIEQVALFMAAEQQAVLDELQLLSGNIDHIKQIIAAQQRFAKGRKSLETFDLAAAMDDAIRMNISAFDRHGVEVERAFEDCPAILADKHQVLQIVVNLLSNAKRAVAEKLDGRKLIRVVIEPVEDGGKRYASVRVIDSGVGIDPANLPKIFMHGFTTRQDGHGFGLHTAAIQARHMGGSLAAASDGPGLGAAFTLKLPLTNEEALCRPAA
ncbi:MAG TPA: ATP-binding protein [Tepidisphaeraceae bacterium]|jgi:signal transduction histidine kinase|nr:ATP-binding protein [Tepidisphaeraceae bacterium]